MVKISGSFPTSTAHFAADASTQEKEYKKHSQAQFADTPTLFSSSGSGGSGIQGIMPFDPYDNSGSMQRVLCASMGTSPPSTSDGIDLSKWLLATPVDASSGHLLTVPNTQLEGGYQSANFYKGADGATVFEAPVTGAHYNGSKNARSELREVDPNGTAAEWNMNAGTATMEGTCAVNSEPTGGICVGQLKGDPGGADPAGHPMAMVQYRNGEVELSIHPDPGSAQDFHVALLDNIPLNQKFSYTMKLTPGGQLQVTATSGGQAKTWTGNVDSSWGNGVPLHFAGGCYLQGDAQSEASNQTGQVSYYNLQTQHSEGLSNPSPTASPATSPTAAPTTTSASPATTARPL